MADPREFVGEFVTRLAAVSRNSDDVRAVAVVGSVARGCARVDSDVDVVWLTDDIARYVLSEDWARDLGAVGGVTTRDWGAITERRFTLASGLEVDFGVGDAAWASIAPVDAGTRRVVGDGLEIIHDPDGLLAALLDACG